MTGLILSRPSYKSGGYYSPENGGMPRYPQLWDGCAGAWSMGLGESNPLLDQSGFANNGVIGGSSWGFDQWGPSLDFDGVNDYVDMGATPTELQIDGVMSGCVWIKDATGGGAGSRTILGDYSPGAYLLRLTNDKLQIYWSGAVRAATSSITIADTNWHFVAFIRTGISGDWDVTFFIDDAIETTSGIATDPTSSFDNFRLGNLGVGTTQVFDGLMDDVRIYNRALNQDEIAILARRPNIAYERLTQIPVGEPFAVAGFQPAWAGASTHTVIA